MLSQLPFNASVLSVALLGAIAYGSGDFLGGRASLRISPAGAVSLAQCAAMFMALQAYLHSGASWPETGGAVLGVAVGIAYASALLFLYKGIAHGRIGIVAPLCGVFSILVPLVADLMLGRAIGAAQFLGIFTCGAAVLLLAATVEPARPGFAAHFSVRLGVLSGLCYGLSDVFLGVLSPAESAGALLMARSVAALLAVSLLVAALFRRQVKVPAAAPARRTWPWRAAAIFPAMLLAVTAGLLDAVGHMSYLHAATQGSMAVAAALVSLFPAVVVVLAVVILRERLTGQQVVGLFASIAGVMMLAT